MAGVSDIGLTHVQIGGLVILARQADQRIVYGGVVHAAVGGLIGETERGLTVGQDVEHRVAAEDFGFGGGAAVTVLGVGEIGVVQRRGQPALRGGEPRLPDI